MGAIQKFALRILPASWARSLEHESREWHVRCNECSSEASVWELGGIRWKAAGNALSRKFCVSCGHYTEHELYRKRIAD